MSLRELEHCSPRRAAAPCAGSAGHPRAIVVAGMLVSSVAMAEEPLDRGRPGQPASDLSPQSVALEVRFGPYTPKVDENTPQPIFDDFFGDGNRYMLGLEVDWQIWRAPYIGTLGVGGGWGYTQMSAPNRVPDPPPDPPLVSQVSTLKIMPFYAVGVLRVDVLARRVGIPLVPYGKLGLAHAFWWVNDGTGTSETDDGVKGADTSTGTQAAVGAMFLLDALEGGAARALDAEMGINNSYVFFEWSMSDFGGDQMNVGSSNWVTGLAFEM